MKSQNVLLHHKAYIVIGSEKTKINAIRVYKNEDIKKFEIGFVANGTIVDTIVTKNISIRIISDSKKKQDIIEFLSEAKKIIAKVFIDDNLDKLIYKKYINAMSI